MTYPSDRVLVGGVRRKRDLTFIRANNWYWIPKEQMPHGVFVEYIALFVQSKLVNGQPSGIYYFGRRGGVELQYRRDLFPKQPKHANANKQYYKIQLHAVIPKTPPILNPTNRRFAFIHTTWDRFLPAQTIAELYSDADHLVDRVYHALRDHQIRSERFWESEQQYTRKPPQVRVLCDSGRYVVASTEPDSDDEFDLLDEQSPDDILQAILERIEAEGGAVMPPIPIIR